MHFRALGVDYVVCKTSLQPAAAATRTVDFFSTIALRSYVRVRLRSKYGELIFFLLLFPPPPPSRFLRLSIRSGCEFFPGKLRALSSVPCVYLVGPLKVENIIFMHTGILESYIEFEIAGVLRITPHTHTSNASNKFLAQSGGIEEKTTAR